MAKALDYLVRVDAKPRYNFLNPYCLYILMAVFTDPSALFYLFSATRKRA